MRRREVNMKRTICIFLSIILALSSCSQSASAWQEQYDLGMRYLSEGNYEEAIIALTAAIEIDPKRADAYLQLAEVYIRTNDLESAARVINQGIDACGESDVFTQLLDQVRNMNLPQNDTEVNNTQNTDTAYNSADPESTQNQGEEPSERVSSVALSELLQPIAYYGETLQCQMTADQASAFAETIESEVTSLKDQIKSDNYLTDAGSILSYAVLIDIGNGIPALLYAGGFVWDFMYKDVTEDGCWWSERGSFGLWQYIDGEPVLYTAGVSEFSFHDSYLFISRRQGSWPPQYDRSIYLAINGTISTSPLTTAQYGIKTSDSGDALYTDAGDFIYTYTIDGKAATETEFQTWTSTWQDTGVVGTSIGGGVEGKIWGMRSAEATAAVLRNYASALQ